MSANVLPDSRLRESKGAVMGLWQLPSGQQVRVEAHPIYCVGCGIKYAYCPIENLAAVTCICQKCYDKDPNVFVGYVGSDQEFCEAVQYEMQRIHGHDLSIEEICALDAQGRLGTSLELLARESPFPVPTHAEDWIA